MITRDDYEYLSRLPHWGKPFDPLNATDTWYASDDTLITVAQILDRYGTFPSTSITIQFFESPRKWERAIQHLITEYEREGMLQCQTVRVPDQGIFQPTASNEGYQDLGITTNRQSAEFTKPTPMGHRENF